MNQGLKWMNAMNLLKKISLAFTPLLLSLVIATPGLAEDTPAASTTKDSALTMAAAKSRLIGTWKVNLTKGQIESHALFSFLPGGVLIQSENPMVVPIMGNLVFGPAQGIWEQNKDGSFSIRYLKLVHQADALYYDHEETTGTLTFDKDNKLVGKMTVGLTQADDSNAGVNKVTLSGTKVNAVKTKQ